MLKGQQLELLWVDSAIDAFFLHVQGSGRVVFEDGSVVRVGYAGRNGRRYTPIGRELVAKGIIPQKKVSLQSIRQWLAENPIAGRQLMEKNQSYIFFRLMEGDGPIGAQGVQLTPGRSLAVDRKYIPLGVPVWLNTSEPGKSRKPLRRLVMTQDTGSAIRGPVRGDLFFGFGNEAGLRAGHMREIGTYYLLLPKKESP
jgi:membrane-bound lytic murein transglycosylase A